LINVGNVKFSH